MGTQVPKALGIGMMVVGVPLILWDASNVHDNLSEIDTATSSREARVDRCIAKSGEFNVDPRRQYELCGCLVDEAQERGLYQRYGRYEVEGMETVVKYCAWELGL